MGFPSVVARTTTIGPAETTDVAVNIGSPANGDLVLIIAAIKSPADKPITVFSGFTPIVDQDDRIAVNFQYAAYKICDGTEGASVTASLTTAGVFVAVAYRFAAGTYTGVPAFATPARNGSANPNSPSLTSGFGAVDTLFISAASSYNNTTVSVYPTDYLNGTRVNYGSTNNPTLFFADRQLNAVSDDPSAYTIGSSNEWVATTFAVQGADTVVSRSVFPFFVQ